MIYFTIGLTFILIIVIFLVKVYFLYYRGWCKSKVCLSGKTVIVTGSNSGIGYETALEFATRGARVILACRDLKRAEKAKKEIISRTENNNVVVKELDHGSLQSINDFAKDIDVNEKRLDILVNNAECVGLEDKISDDGLQILMQVNYFGPLLLTILLIDLLRKTGCSRIINVSSSLAQKGNLTLDNLNKWPGSHFLSYSNSKLGNILFTKVLSGLLGGSTVTVYSLNPGVIPTDIFRFLNGWMYIVVCFGIIFYFKTPKEGAQTTLYIALQQGLEEYSGQHFEDCQIILPYKKAGVPFFADEIWNETIKLLKCEKMVKELLENYDDFLLINRHLKNLS